MNQTITCRVEIRTIRVVLQVRLMTHAVMYNALFGPISSNFYDVLSLFSQSSLYPRFIHALMPLNTPRLLDGRSLAPYCSPYCSPGNAAYSVLLNQGGGF